MSSDAADEVEEAVLVGDHGVAGPDRELRARATAGWSPGSGRNRCAVRSGSFQ